MKPLRKTLFLALCAVLAGAGVVSAAERPVQAYDGAARIGNLYQVTIAYPAAAGGQQAVSLDSARLRASYLLERYGVESTIVADDAVSEEQLSGHLLLLGWDNRLLGTERAPAPFRREDGKLEFLGQEVGRDDDDLLFMALSPYNQDKYLIFWSRIDPPLDRFLAFPFLGSDWGVYRDYFILEQGMFEDAPGWPPTRNTHAEHRSYPYRAPVVASSEHYTVRGEPGQITQADLDLVVKARERALSRAAGLLAHEPDRNFKIDLYLYRDATQKHELTGVADAVHSVPAKRELHLPVTHARSENPHEEIHLLAAEKFGPCSLTAMYEGLAVYLELRDREQELLSYAGLLVEQGVELDLAGLLDDEKLRKMARGGLGMSGAALLVQWLHDLGGLEAVGRVYSAGHGQALGELARLARTEDAEAAFRAWVVERAAGAGDELAFRKVMARAVERGRVGDFAGRAEALTEASRLRPGNLELVYQIALALTEVGRYDEARVHLERLIDAAPAQPAYLLTYSHFQLGRVHEREGRKAEAVEAYRSVLALPDNHDSHRRANERLAALATGSDG